MRAHRFFAACTLCLLCCAALAVAQNTRGTQSAPALQSGTPIEIPLATASRIGRAKNSWWPTKNAQAPEDLVGNKVCATCHAEKTASQIATPMARAASRVSSAKVLRDHPCMTATRGKFVYAISQTAEGFAYSVSDGANRISATLLWAFGIANKGQTYIYEKGGEFYESEMSYYSAIAGLDVTTGHEQKRPITSEDALGTLQDPPAVQKCFACHTTGATTVSGGFAPENAMPGVSCEACHGPGGSHVMLMQQLQGEAANPGTLQILNPRSFSPVASVDFCGACHRTWADVYEMQVGVTGPVNSRFQPYRLEKSKCWGDGDARLTCVACHDPHQQLQRDAAAYDQKCLACHRTAAKPKSAAPAPATAAGKATPSPAASRNRKACPVATTRCVTCHMPKVNVAVMHSDFTDHRIRIVRQGETYPN
jgi:Cytochrome c554 and c-prime